MKRKQDAQYLNDLNGTFTNLIKVCSVTNPVSKICSFIAGFSLNVFIVSPEMYKIFTISSNSERTGKS